MSLVMKGNHAIADRTLLLFTLQLQLPLLLLRETCQDRTALARTIHIYLAVSTVYFYWFKASIWSQSHLVLNDIVKEACPKVPIHYLNKFVGKQSHFCWTHEEIGSYRPRLPLIGHMMRNLKKNKDCNHCTKIAIHSSRIFIT